MTPGLTIRPDPSESEILADVLIAVTALPGGMFERMNTGAAQDRTGRVIRFGTRGGPDVRGTYYGQAVAIETKTLTGRLSPDQIVWRRNFERAGGIYILARCKQDALDGLDAVLLARGPGRAA